MTIITARYTPMLIRSDIGYLHVDSVYRKPPRLARTPEASPFRAPVQA
jgi:hypothetical protein